MKRITAFVLALALLLCAAAACAEAPRLSCSFLSAEETAAVLLGLDEYYARINRKTLDFFLQRKDGTTEEYRDHSAAQALDFTAAQRELITAVTGALERNMDLLGVKLPGDPQIRFAVTTMKEAAGADGYTHGNTVFLNADYLDEVIALSGTARRRAAEEDILRLIAHELFHCLTRGDPEFRRRMYAIIGFTVADAEFEFPAEIREQIIVNPDVPRHDSFATFTVRGRPTDCCLVFLSKNTFEKPGDNFFDGAYTGLVSVEDGTLYGVGDASDFWQVVGRNTSYVEDPEECMADNFSFALVCGPDRTCPDPRIPRAVIDALRQPGDPEDF